MEQAEVEVEVEVEVKVKVKVKVKVDRSRRTPIFFKKLRLRSTTLLLGS